MGKIFDALEKSKKKQKASVVSLKALDNAENGKLAKQVSPSEGKKDGGGQNQAQPGMGWVKVVGTRLQGPAGQGTHGDEIRGG